jgi:hypothetical protein
MADQGAAEVKTGQDTQTVNATTQQGATPGAEQKDKGVSGAGLTNSTQPFIVKGTQNNVLHSYRSWNYVFTLSALEDKDLSNPKRYEESSQRFIIAKSSGKGSSQITNKLSTAVVSNTTTNAGELVSLINDFNKTSPGRFDFVIENVKITSLMTYSPETTTSLADKITFDVIEPYSMGGFLQALDVAAQATGAITYPAAHYVFKVEFLGYNDKNTGPDGSPEVIPGSTRFYPVLINAVTVETTDKGTTYRVSCTPFNQKSFGGVSKLKSDTKMQGETVGELLKDMFVNINKAIAEEAEKVKGPETRNKDEYEIYFAKQEAPGTTIVSLKEGRTPEWTESGSIFAAKLNQGLRGNQTAAMSSPDTPNPGPGYAGQENKTNNPSATTPTSIKYEPGTNQTSFPQGSSIAEAIEAVIRDSEFTKDIIKNLDDIKKGDGIVTYFMIRTETEIIPGAVDPQGLAKNKLHRFIVAPYKIHYTRLPGEQLGISDFKGIKNQIRRTYDYLYMGKNKDVINFNLKFNNLYFQSIPPRTGARDSNAAATGAGAANSQNLQAPKADLQSVKDSKNPTAKVMSVPGGFVAVNGLSGQARQDTPYHTLAQTMHNAIVQSVDLATCTIDIYGDPYYLTTGGIGNQTHELADKGITKNGEAPLYSGEVYVNVNWRTPIDYNTFEKGGSVYFDAELLPFSGIYKVTNVSSDLAGGTFKQTLKLLRMPGQLIEAKKTSVDSGFKATPKPGEQQVKDIAPAGVQSSGTRPNEFDIASIVRGLPNAGAAGSIPNFVNAVAGGIGGALGLVTSGLGSVAGLGGAVQNIVGQIKTIAPQLGINVGSSLNGIDSLAQGIRLSSSGISNIVGGVSKLAPASVASVNNLVSGILPTANSSAILASGVVNQISAAGGSVADISSKLTGATVDAVNQVKGQADALVGGAKSAVAAVTQGIPNVDPTALAASVGIDPAQLSGIDASLKSKIIGQLQSIKDAVPDNVDINAFKGQGLVMANLTKENISNLPPIQAETMATTTFEETKTKLNSLSASLGKSIPGASNLPGISGINQLTNQLGQAAGGLTAGLGAVGTTALTDKLTTAQAGLNNLVGSSLNVTNGLSGLTSAQAGLGSVESNISAVKGMVQAGVGDLANTAAAKFGSLRTASPLDALVASANKDNSLNGWGEG